MGKDIPISEKSPNAIMEVLLRLKVKDAMVKNLITANRHDTLREVQHVMKTRKITGMPVIDDRRLVGMVTIGEIVSALDEGYIDELVDKHMSKSLIVLEEDMPMSFAVTYFNKYTYKRFPVVNRQKELVGLISSKNILTSILNELESQIKELEEKLLTNKPDLPDQIHKEFLITQFDFEKAGHASYEVKKVLKEKNVPAALIRRASIASYEMEINVVIHSIGGKLIFILDDSSITIMTADNGPGIPDISKVMEEGYSTANDWIRSLGFGAGMGIPNTKRVSDKFEITSEVGRGTTMISIIYLEKKNESE